MCIGGVFVVVGIGVGRLGRSFLVGFLVGVVFGFGGVIGIVMFIFFVLVVIFVSFCGGLCVWVCLLRSICGLGLVKSKCLQNRKNNLSGRSQRIIIF